MNRYERVMSLIQVQWKYTKKFLIGIIILLLGSEGYFLYSNLAKTTFKRMEYDYATGALVETSNSWSLRFEELLAMSYWDKIFIIAVVATLLLLVSIAFRQKSASMAEYTYLRLPISSNTLYFTKILHSLSVLLILLGVQFASVLLGYQMYLYMVPQEAVMHGGLFLAFVRWNFLLQTYPIIDPLRVVLNIAYVVHLAMSAAYMNVCILLKVNRPGPVILVIIFYLIFYNPMSIFGFVISFGILILSMIWMYKNYKGMITSLGGE